MHFVSILFFPISYTTRRLRPNVSILQGNVIGWILPKYKIPFIGMGVSIFKAEQGLYTH
jgi:hypothetical protein